MFNIKGNTFSNTAIRKSTRVLLNDAQYQAALRETVSLTYYIIKTYQGFIELAVDLWKR